MSTPPVRPVLADGHRLFRQGLRELLERQAGYAGEALTPRERASVRPLAAGHDHRTVAQAALLAVQRGLIPTPKMERDE